MSDQKEFDFETTQAKLERVAATGKDVEGYREVPVSKGIIATPADTRRKPEAPGHDDAMRPLTRSEGQIAAYAQFYGGHGMPKINLLNLQDHPLAQEFYGLALELEKLPASPQQTALMNLLGELRNDAQALLNGETIRDYPQRVRQQFMDDLSACIPAIQTTDHKRELIKAGMRSCIVTYNARKKAENPSQVVEEATAKEPEGKGNYGDLDYPAPNHFDPSKRGFDPK